MASELEEMFLGGQEEEEGGEMEEVMTSEQALKELHKAWIDEKNAPDLLPDRADLVQVMLEQVEQMEENVKLLEKGDLRRVIHLEELERIKYVISSYQRCRLRKIESYTIHYLHKSDATPRLAANEVEFATSFASSVVSHLSQVCRLLPEPYDELEADSLYACPDMETHVMAKSNTDVTVTVNDDDVPLAVGSQHVIPYAAIATNVAQQTVSLL